MTFPPDDFLLRVLAFAESAPIPPMARLRAHWQFASKSVYSGRMVGLSYNDTQDFRPDFFFCDFSFACRDSLRFGRPPGMPVFTLPSANSA